MPNWTDHSVFNLDETIAVGDNFLFENTFEEWVNTDNPDMDAAMLEVVDEKTRRRATEAQRQDARARMKLGLPAFEPSSGNIYDNADD